MSRFFAESGAKRHYTTRRTTKRGHWPISTTATNWHDGCEPSFPSSRAHVHAYIHGRTCHPRNADVFVCRTNSFSHRNGLREERVEILRCTYIFLPSIFPHSRCTATELDICRQYSRGYLINSRSHMDYIRYVKCILGTQDGYYKEIWLTEGKEKVILKSPRTIIL